MAANIPIRQIPGALGTPNESTLLAMDNGIETQKVTAKAVVFAGRPTATQQQALDGIDNEAAMTPLRVAQAIPALAGTQFATSAQGELAQTAVQPDRQISAGEGLSGGGSLAANRTLGLSAASIASLALADSAVQPGQLQLPYPLPTVAGGSFDPERLVPLAYTRTSLSSRVNGFGFVGEVAADSPPHEYDPMTGEYLGVRFQPASTDFGLYSESISNAYWTKYRGAMQTSSVLSPNGIAPAEFFGEDTQTGVHGFGKTNISFVAGQTYFLSAFVRSTDFAFYHGAFEWAGGNNTFVTWNAANRTASSQGAGFAGGGVIAFPDGWFLVWASAVAPISTSSAGRIYMGATPNGVASYTGVNGRGFYVWGVRLALRRSPDSYVRSEATTGVRTVANATGPLTPAPYGSILVEGRFNTLPVGDNARMASFFGDTNNRVHLSVTPAGALQAGIVLNGSSGLIAGPTVIAGQKFRAVVGWALGRQVLAVDGVIYTPTTPLNERFAGQGALSLAQTALSGGDRVGDVSITEARLFPRVMTNDEAQTVSSPKDGSRVASRVYLEAGSDLSSDIIATWHGTADFPATADYRLAGASAWQSAPATVRDFPSSTEKVFSAYISGLTPNSLYEWRTGGSGLADVRRFRTAPVSGRTLRVDFAADWQGGSASPTDAGSMWNSMNNTLGSGGADVILLGGDLAADDGGANASRTANWAAFMDAWSSRFVRPDGTMIPVAAIAGNHEAGPGTAGPGSYTGNQPYGYIDRLFTTFYRSAPNVGGKGYGAFSIGTELLVVGLETHHGTPLDDVQIGWLRDTLAARAASYKHVLVMGHFSPGSYDNGHWTALFAGPALRERVFPIIQQYPNAKFYLHGHNHALQSTRKVKWTPNNPPTGRNLWFEDPQGIRCLGAGGWDSWAAVGYNVQDQSSEIDGSVLVDKLVATNLPVRGVTPISAPNNTGADPATRHFWRMTFGTASARAQAISLNGTTLIDITEAV